MSVYSGIQQSSHEKSMAEYNAKVDQMNAQNARNEASAAARGQRQANASRVAQIRAIQGSRGFVGVGSPLEQLADAASTFEMEAMDIERQGEINAQNYLTRSNMSQVQAHNISRSIPLAAASTALSGASRIGSSLVTGL